MTNLAVGLATGVALLAAYALKRRRLLATVMPAIRQAIFKQPDVINLRRVENPPWKRAERIAELTNALAAEGFQDAGAFAIDKMPGVLVRLMVNPDMQVTAGLCDHPQAGAWTDLVTHYEDGRTLTATTVPDTGMPQPEWLKFLRLTDASPARLCQELLRARPSGGIRTISAAEAPREFEKGYYLHAAWLRNRELGPNDLQKLARQRIKDASEKTPYLTARKAQKRHEARYRWTAAICIPMGLAGCLAAYGCFVLAWNARGLHLRGKLINATADDFRVIRHKGTHGQVRYHFQPDPKGPVYSARDPFRGQNSWTSIRLPVLEEAKKTRFVPVIYDTANPWNNETAQAPGLTGITDSPWFFILGAVPFLVVGGFTLLLGFSALGVVLCDLFF